MGNIFDEYAEFDLTPEQRAEVERYIELWRDIQHEEAALKAQDLARQLMALSTLLADDDSKNVFPASQSTSSTSKFVRGNAELIHRRIAESRHGS